MFATRSRQAPVCRLFRWRARAQGGHLKNRKSRSSRELAILDELIEDITTDAYGEDEQLWAFWQAFEDDVPLPADGFVIGEPVSVVAIDHDGNERRGLTAKCRREDGSEHEVAASDVVFPERSRGARYVAAYRKWLGLEPYPDGAPAPSRRKRQQKATADDLLKAERILMELCEADLRCLDAHAYLGNFVFDSRPEHAIRHYEVGLRIGELSLGDGFDGVLPWDHIDNRPFLRCMHGFGLCLWRLGRFDEAGRVFDRMLRVNPSDNQGVRFLIQPIKARMTWEKGRDSLEG